MKTRRLKLLLKVMVVVAVLLLVLATMGKLANIYAFWDRDPDRGAIAMTEDPLGETFDTPIYLDQNWKPQDSLWFYTVTQGSGLMPYDFFMVLEQKDSNELFRSNKNFNRYRYLPQKATFSNPDGLPVGFVKDTYRGKEYVGFTCAACHTGQINYQGKAIRIDGAPTTADLDSFLNDLGRALTVTVNDETKRKAFVSHVMARNGFKRRMRAGREYTSEAQVIADLNTFTQRVVRYNVINHTPVEYGYARLDAFGRIYNRVLEHIITRDQLADAIGEVLPESETAQIMDDVDKDIIETGARDHLVTKLEAHATLRQMLKIRDKLFNKPTAPTSYPFLWDIAQHDYVQWNGVASNAGLGPIGRNAGEVIGVFAILDWQEKPGRTLSSWIGGQRAAGRHVSYTSSVDIANLRAIEAKLGELESPKWAPILPPIDKERAARGRVHFRKYCSSCHQDIRRDDPLRTVIAQMTDVATVGTDPKMAQNGVNYSGYSGITEGQYLGISAGRVFIPPRAPVFELLTIATTNVVATPDPDKIFLRRWADWIYQLGYAYFKSDTPETIKRGQYIPDTTVAPFGSLMAYKSRPLNGIWATAPYLHNGSVPTLYDLLLPQKKKDDPPQGLYRPEQFWVGKREFDPVKVGITSVPGQGFLFRTTVEGNGNGGHEYGNGISSTSSLDDKGVPLPPLTDEQRWELVEYLKTL